MSQYINFYLKTDDKWVNLANYCRNTDLFIAAQPFTPFEKLKQIDQNWMNDVMDELQARVEHRRKQLDFYQKTYDDIKDMNNSVAEKMSAYEEIQELLDECDTDLDCANAAVGRLLAFQDMIDNIPEDTSLWVGIEAAPEGYYD